jgi:hypothetical protein
VPSSAGTQQGEGEGEGEGEERAAEDHSNSTLSLSAKELALHLPLPELCMQAGDIFAVDWPAASDVAYAASLLFSDDMMRQLSRQGG